MFSTLLKINLSIKFNDAFYFFVLLLLFLGPHSKPLSPSHLIPYILIILIFKFIEINHDLIAFIFFYLVGISFIVYFTYNNDVDIFSLVSLLDNLIRVILIFIIGMYFGKNKSLVLMFKIMLVLTFIISFLHIFSSEFIKEFYLVWYANPRKAMQSITMHRAIATFSSPANLGYFALICILFFSFEKVSKKNLYVFLAIFVGIFSVSKTFLLGVLLITLLLIIRRTKRNKISKKVLFNSVLFVSLFTILFFILYATNEEFNYIVQRSFSSITNLERAYEIRYQHSTFNMSMKIIDVFPAGNGILATQSEDLFIGDSGYLMTLFYGGLFSFLSFYISFVFLLKKNNTILIFFLIAFLVELGRPAFYASRSADLFWLVTGYFFRKELNDYHVQK